MSAQTVNTARRYWQSIAAGIIALVASSVDATPASAPPALQMPAIVVAAPDPGGVRVTDDGLVGNWYPGPGGAMRAAVLLLGGSEGGIGAGTARQAHDLVAHGFAVLQLAYFGAPGLPDKLDAVPLETFDRALAWLARQPGVDAQRIGIVGASKGAEAALLVAARHPELGAAVVGAPSAAVWPGIDFTGSPTGSSWTLAGQPLPYLRYGADASSTLGAYRAGLATLAAHGDAAIPVRRIRAPVLLVCGMADALWPSCDMARIVAAKLGHRATVLAYANAGHALFGPPVAPDAPGYLSLGSLGGSAAGNDAARADAWPRVLAFLATNLGR